MDLFEINITILVIVLFLVVALIVGLGIWQIKRISNRIKATDDDLTSSKALIKAEEDALNSKTNTVSSNLGTEITTRTQIDADELKQLDVHKKQISELIDHNSDLGSALDSAFSSIEFAFGITWAGIDGMDKEMIKQEAEIDTIQHKFIQEEQQRQNAYNLLNQSVTSLQNNLVNEEQHRISSDNTINKFASNLQQSLVAEEQQRINAYSLLNKTTSNLQNSAKSLDQQFTTLSASLQGTQKIVGAHINAAGGLSGTNLTLNSGIQVTNGDPGTLIEKSYGSKGDRYGVGQFPYGAARLYTASAYEPATANMSIANSDGSFQDVVTVGKQNNGPYANVNGKFNVKGDIQTSGQLCVGGTCINEAQFKTLAH